MTYNPTHKKLSLVREQTCKQFTFNVVCMYNYIIIYMYLIIYNLYVKWNYFIFYFIIYRVYINLCLYNL